jgi:hypothetical protein
LEIIGKIETYTWKGQAPGHFLYQKTSHFRGRFRGVRDRVRQKKGINCAFYRIYEKIEILRRGYRRKLRRGKKALFFANFNKKGLFFLPTFGKNDFVYHRKIGGFWKKFQERFGGASDCGRGREIRDSEEKMGGKEIFYANSIILYLGGQFSPPIRIK